MARASGGSTTGGGLTPKKKLRKYKQAYRAVEALKKKYGSVMLGKKSKLTKAQQAEVRKARRELRSQRKTLAAEGYGKIKTTKDGRVKGIGIGKALEKATGDTGGYFHQRVGQVREEKIEKARTRTTSVEHRRGNPKGGTRSFIPTPKQVTEQAIESNSITRIAQAQGVTTPPSTGNTVLDEQNAMAAIRERERPASSTPARRAGAGRVGPIKRTTPGARSTEHPRGTQKTVAPPPKPKPVKPKPSKPKKKKGGRR